MRDHLRANRYELAVEAAARYPDVDTIAGTPLLTRASWVPVEPVPLSRLEVRRRPAPEVSLPAASGDNRYASYSSAVAAMDRPTVFENRPTWRLVDADLAGAAPRLSFGDGTYFDGIDTGEAAAHEFAAADLGAAGLPLRAAVGDPTDLLARPANLAVSCLTVRRDPGGSTFLLHWRDPAKVGHAGGLHQVVPVGVFQSAGPNDFDLWRFVLREYAEELLGSPELHGPIDYENWPFAVAMTEALASGGIEANCLGLGVDPLTFATDLLVSVVVDAPVFDEIFGSAVSVDDEGVVTTLPFTADALDGLRMQAAGAAVVRLALGA